jgi:hypothetical protein
MRGWIRFGVIGAAAFAACKFNPGDMHVDGSVTIDAPTITDAHQYMDAPDAGPCNAMPSCVNATTLSACMDGSNIASTVTCSWGCVDGSNETPHCGELVPSGGIANAADTVGSDLLTFALVDGAAIDTTTGQISNNGAMNRAAGSGVVNGVDFEPRATGALFRFGALTLTGKVHFTQTQTGNPPVVLLSVTTMDIEGAIDGEGGCNGGGGGPGGFQAGGGHQSAAGSGGGSGGGATDFAQGGGGGGNGGSGANGGDNDSTTSTPPAGGAAFGDDNVTQLVGGGGGGGGGNDGDAFGGGGGGGIQLIANDKLTIGSNASINAGGCGGTSGSATGAPNPGGGGGGGAGGTILIEASQIEIAGALTVGGGGGGAGDVTTGNHDHGANGSNADIGAPGSQMSLVEANGGEGAFVSTLSFPAGTGASSGMFGGGGGGGIGRMRFNTYGGSATIDLSAVLDPPVSSNLLPTTCTEGSAATQ